MIGRRVADRAGLPSVRSSVGIQSSAGWERWVDALALGGVLAVLATILPPDLLLTPTIPAGGDTPSHYATAVYLRDRLLPNGQLSGWTPGNYAGFPILQFYFPLVFLLIVLLGTALPFPVAFKLGTVLGTALLPLSAYVLVRLLGFRFPTPTLAAGATVVFLLQDGNAAWGGNLQSTLAGEFAFSLGFALSLLFLGTVWAGVRAGRGAVANGVLLACLGLAHGYALLFAGCSVLVLIAIADDCWRALRYLVMVYALAFCLLGAWLLPLLANLPNTTAFAPAWFIASWTEVLPKTFWPPVLLAGLWTIGLGWKRIRLGAPPGAAAYLWYGASMSASGYLLGPWLHVVDVRFLPFGQVLLVLLGAIALGEFARRLRLGPLLGFLATGALIAWSASQAVQLPGWIKWNYSGLEQKPLWPAYRDVTRLLAGSVADPRVVYEHSMIHNGAGSPRVFESLPLFAGRSTLEGLYLQASPTAPFVFYLQAELSKEASCPFSHLACTRFHVAHALRHLQLFNVREIIAVSQELKSALRARHDVDSIAQIPPYEVFRLQGEDDLFRYVEPLAVEPVLVQTSRWKEVAYQWFRLIEGLDVHLVFPINVRSEQLTRFTSITPDQLLSLPRRPIERPDAGPVVSRVFEDAIEFDTPYPGYPHLIKVSYHPNWHVQGAGAIYLVSPSFMLVYPEVRHVRLWYGPRWPERIGAGLSMAGLLLSFLVARCLRRERLAAPGRLGPVGEWLGKGCGLAAAGLPIVLLVAAGALRVLEPVPGVLLNEGIQARDRGNYETADALFRRILDRAPASGAAEQAAYYLAIVQYLRGDMEGTIRLFYDMIRVYPTSPFVPEGYYHIGLAHLRSNRISVARTTFQKVVQDFSDTAWARYAQDRLAELQAGSYGAMSRPVLQATAP